MALPTYIYMNIIQIAWLQCPVHIHSLSVLRQCNEHFVESGHTEHDCGSGQIVAIVLIGANIPLNVDWINQ
jgi:hypothetical protein